MAEPKVAQKAPYVQDTKAGTYYWCACGRSSTQPFCDGSHKGTPFAPLKTEVKTDGNKAWCGCKHTKTPPFCDGSHKKLP